MTGSQFRCFDPLLRLEKKDKLSKKIFQILFINLLRMNLIFSNFTLVCGGIPSSDWTICAFWSRYTSLASSRAFLTCTFIISKCLRWALIHTLFFAKEIIVWAFWAGYLAWACFTIIWTFSTIINILGISHDEMHICACFTVILCWSCALITMRATLIAYSPWRKTKNNTMKNII